METSRNTILKIGDKVTFDNDKIEQFKAETASEDREVQRYRKIVLAGIDQVGTVKSFGYALTTVSFDDGWELPLPTKYLISLPQ